MVSDTKSEEVKELNQDGASWQVGEGDPASTDVPDRRNRKERFDDDVDPIRALVLHELTAAAYRDRHGVWPRPVDLNREIPASTAGPQRSGAWNRMRMGKGLPRSAAAPQGVLMRRLAELYPRAAASYSWPIWILSSRAPLTLAQIHGLMLQLPDGIRHMLIGSYLKGRFLRFPTDPYHEVGFMAKENSLGGLTALIAQMREAELKQDPLTHGVAYYTMQKLLPVLDKAFGSSVLGQRFAAFLCERFLSMEYIIPGSYESAPGSDPAPKRAKFMLPNRYDHEAALKFHAEWLGWPPGLLEEVLKAQQT